MTPKKTTTNTTRLPLNPSRYGDIRIDRHRGPTARDYLCVACNEEEGEAEMLEVTLGGDEYGFYVCPYHESMLLAVLLRNWLRRQSRGKNPPAIFKEPEDQMEAAMQRDIEMALAREE